jgi:hypothetical protein
MANSIHFNPGGGKVTTISRAIVLLGFDVVRDICLSISLIDTFLRGPHREVVVAEMAHCFHAAMQAKALAELSRLPEPEEVFIATLLYPLGTLAFWCFAAGIDDSAAARLRSARRDGVLAQDTEREVLGFRLVELTARLNREWKLSPLLASTLDPSVPQTPRTRAVGYGHEIARALTGAAGAPTLDDVLQRATRSLRVKGEEAQARVLLTARAAADAIALLGAPEAARQIPATGSIELTAENSSSQPGVHPTDSGLQLEILRELSQLMLEPRPDVNLMLEMVLEGIYRGVGMDRAVFALLSQDRSQLRAKFVLGNDRDAFHERFVFDAAPPTANALASVLQTGEPAWLGRAGNDAGPRPDPLLRELSGGQCFLMPLAVAGKPIGVLYADRARSGRPMSDELYAQFKLFGQQARMGIAWIKGQ